MSSIEIVTKHDADADDDEEEEDDDDDTAAQKSLFLKSPINLPWPHFPLVLLFRPGPGFHSERNDYFYKTHNFWHRFSTGRSFLEHPQFWLDTEEKIQAPSFLKMLHKQLQMLTLFALR